MYEPGHDHASPVAVLEVVKIRTLPIGRVESGTRLNSNAYPSRYPSAFESSVDALVRTALESTVRLTELLEVAESSPVENVPSVQESVTTAEKVLVPFTAHAVRYVAVTVPSQFPENSYAKCAFPVEVTAIDAQSDPAVDTLSKTVPAGRPETETRCGRAADVVSGRTNARILKVCPVFETVKFRTYPELSFPGAKSRVLMRCAAEAEAGIHARTAAKANLAAKAVRMR